MTISDGELRQQRVLVLAPTGKDAALTREILSRADIACVCCPNLGQICRELAQGAGVLLIAEEALGPDRDRCLDDWLAHQPPWSDLPVLVLARPGADSTAVARAIDVLGNVTVLERPTRVAALVSACRSALRARARQYEARDHFNTQNLLAAIVESSDDAIISKTLEGHILTWNAGAQRLYGYTAAEVVGRPITLLIPPERQHEEPAILERLGRGERIEHFETVRVRKDGRRIDISLSVSPVRNADGRIIAASKVARDITEQKRTEQQLRHSEQRFRLMADAVPVLIWVSDVSKRCTWFNKGWRDFSGRPLEELLGDGWAQDVHPEDLDRCLNVYRTHFDARQPFSMEYRLKRRDGEFRWMVDVGIPQFDVDGDFAGYVGACVDFTERQANEQALRDADRRKDEFLAMLAHELRNPLAPIRNSLNILRLSHRSDPTVEQVGEMMERQVNHMVRLVDDLLEVSRITRGKIELRKELIELAAVVRSAVETGRPLIEARRIQLALSLPPEPLTLEGDPVRLAQVLANLLNNSAKYTDPGGQIWLSAHREGEGVMISVRDSGMGIPQDMLPRIFDLFMQVDRHADRAHGGLGIGLTLVKSLVEMHGGTVAAHSAGVGQGSEFIIRLPLAAGHRAAGRQGSPSRTNVLAPRRVLVVDDNRDAAKSLGMLLKLLGADVQVVFGGPEALEAIAAHKPAVVLLDIGMPGMDGYEVARRVREQPELSDVTLIALTGWGQDEDRRRTHAAGFNYHLIKPADVRALETLLLSLEG